MANAINPIRNAVRSCLRRHRQRDYIREEKGPARHNKTLGLHISFWKELCRARRKTGCCVDEYFHFAFYNKTDAQRDPYLTLYRQDLIAEKVGDVHRPLTIPGNKVLFHTIFGEFLQREWCNPSACTATEFLAFAARHGEVIVKPSDRAKDRAFTNSAMRMTQKRWRYIGNCAGMAGWWRKCSSSTRKWT